MKLGEMLDVDEGNVIKILKKSPILPYLVNWTVKPISGYVSTHEGFRIKSLPHMKVHLNSSLIRLSHIFSNLLIGQLNQLTDISQPTKDLELKSLSHLKVHLKHM